jgi:hypothetical protein
MQQCNNKYMDVATIYNDSHTIFDEPMYNSNSFIFENSLNTNVQMLLLK